MDQVKIDKVVKMFFNSLRTKEDKTLETGLSHNQTVLILERSVDALIKEHPEKFEKYVYWFENASHYLLDHESGIGVGYKNGELENIG